MRLRDRNQLYQDLVRAESLAVYVTGRALVLEPRECDAHGAEAPHFVSAEPELIACEACVMRSRALADIGRQGGKIGGAKMTPKKAKAFKRAAAKRWPKN